jgi:DNA-binding CsgD family transcriptional regulator
VLVGREDELSLLAERIERRQAIAVLGEAGVGKTSLVRAMAERAGKRLYEAGALSTLSWLPYLPLRRAFGREFEVGDAAYVASEVEREVGAALLFLDDLHWADAQTRALLPFLAGRIPLVGAIRRGDASTTGALEATAGAGFELVPLEPLAAVEAAELAVLLHPELSQAATEQLVSRSGGNPFLLEQLAATGEPSESLKLAVGARLRLLTSSGRDAIGLLALLGRPAARELMGVDGADELVAAGLASGNGELSIRHALIGEATVEELEPEKRRRLHSCLANALTDVGESARHHAAAGERALAHEKALLAAERASTPGERTAHLGVAAANADGAESESLRIEAARAFLEVADYANALSLVESLHSADSNTAAEVALLRSQAHHGLVQNDDADRELAAAVATEVTDATLRIRIAAHRARLVSRDGRFAEAHAIAEEGARLADAAETEGSEVAEIYSTLGYARIFVGAPGGSKAHEHALAVTRRVGASELEFGILSNMLFGLLLAGKPAEADAVALEAVDRARSLRLVMREHTFRTWHAGFAWHLGDPAGAAAEAEAVLAEAVTPMNREFAAPYWWQAMTDLGHGESVRPYVEEEVAKARVDESIGDALWALADIELAAGRPDAAERAAASYFDRFNRAWPFVGVARAWAQFEQEILPTELSRTVLPLAEAAPVEVDALIALTQGSGELAAATFDRAAGLWDDRHVRGAFRCRWAAAESLRRAGRLEEARTRLLLLEPETERRQLNVLLRRIRRSLRLMGVHRTAERTTVGLLTGRELEVLELVADGLTNREIARRLALGRPTVVRLIRSAQQKLGANNRTQAAALAARR